jgi:hypothetical protein
MHRPSPDQLDSAVSASRISLPKRRLTPGFRYFCNGVNMRLSVVESGHRLPQKLLLSFVHAITFTKPVDIIKLFMYRPQYFGKPFCDLAHAALRGPSHWSVGERELFGAFTSKLNRCGF